MATNGSTNADNPQAIGLLSSLKRSSSTTRRCTNTMQDSRMSIAAMSARDDVFDELDELTDDGSPPPTARTINVMVSPSEPLFFNCADPCDGGEQIALFRTISREEPFSDVWPECSPEAGELYEENDDIFVSPYPDDSADDFVSDGPSSASTTTPRNSNGRESVRRRTRHVSEHSIPRIRRMTSSLLTTPRMRRSVLLSVESACSGICVPVSAVPSASPAGGVFTPRKDDEQGAPAMPALTPVSRTRSAAHAKLQRAMSKSAEFQTGWKRFKGVFLALAAGFVFTFSAVAQKYLLTTMNYAQIGLVRFLLLIFFMSPSFVIRRLNPFSLSLIKQHGYMLLLRGIIGGFCFQMRTYAFEKLPIGDATVIMFSSPIFVGLIAKLVLNERYQKVYFITMVATLLGCVLISRPKFIFEPYSTTPRAPVYNDSSVDENAKTIPIIGEDESDGRLIGSLVALLSAFLAACTFVVLRKLRRVDAVIVVFYFGFVGSLISFVLTLVTPPYTLPMPTTLTEYWWIFVLAGSSNVGQWLFTRSLHYENANLVSLMRTVDIVWAFAAQVLLFNVLPHYLSILGTTIVTLSVVFLGLRKLVESLDDDNAFKTRFLQNRLCVFCFPTSKPAPPRRRSTFQRKQQSIRARGGPSGSGGSAALGMGASATVTTADAADATSALFARSISRNSAAGGADRKTVTFPDDNEKTIAQQRAGETTPTVSLSTNMLENAEKSVDDVSKIENETLLVESDEGIALSDQSSPERNQ